MSTYEPRITPQDDSFYALIVRIDSDGQKNVIHGFRRFYKSEKAAVKGAGAYITKRGLN